ncbi:cyclin-dependent kinase inhibitor 2c-related [Anaeramoeba ignava]|uniref:Cyclin-dependent kinase inhibitor 2c-related n=1 Tax=Anaeramoeba ignava TaxID=1746090 RepID=A0A9Q0L6A7_ANAIG|nr:cyclin-dependent kinase inhibitor 2c-related [Anaeramoeba ignava]
MQKQIRMKLELILIQKQIIKNETALHFALQNPNSSFEIIKLLIEKGIDIKGKVYWYKTPLHLACQNINPNSFEIVKYLIEKGININAQTDNGLTALHFVCQNPNPNSFEVIKLLIEKGIDINAKKRYNETALHFVCQNPNPNSVEVIKLLIEKGIDINAKKKGNATALYTICEEANPNLRPSFEVIKLLIESGIDINSGGGFIRQTPLQILCHKHNSPLEITKLFIQKPRDIASTNDLNIFSFYTVCRYSNSLELVKCFIESGIDINSKTKYKRTALHFACENINPSFEIVKLLIEKGADVNAKTSDNETPLHCICKSSCSSSFKIAKLLIEKGIDIHAKTINENKTALHFACENYDQSFKLIKFLIEKGIDINAKTNENKTALYFACEIKELSYKVIKFLIEKGADINAKATKSFYQTPLSILIDKYRDDLVELMLMNNVNVLILEENRITDQFIEMFTQIYSINQDMNQLLNSNENFSDYQIQSIDGFKFNVHKLILLTRFDNNKTTLEKFINICSQKSKEEVQIALNFIYTGFSDFQEIYQNLKERTTKRIIENQKEKENKVEEFFKEIGFDLNWIELKKGRNGIIKDLSKLYQEESTKDFTIIIGDEKEKEKEKEIKVHKLILVLRSELYKGMFLSVQDSSNQVHDYSGKSFETIQELIYFLYHDKFEKKTKEISNEMIKELKDVKDYYQLNPNSRIDLILKRLISWF